MSPVSHDAAGRESLGRLRVSIVCYDSAETQLRETVATLVEACRLCLEGGYLASVEIVLVDNGPPGRERQKLERIMAGGGEVPGVHMRCCGSGENIGFGAGHNLSIDASTSDFHLILNPDVELAADSLRQALAFMGAHADCGVVVPMVANDAGEPEYLCKRYPSVLDLLLRGFAPVWLRARFRQRLDHYEMRDVLGDDVVWRPTLVSGCFMLTRAAVLARLRGFDPAYFLYFEDYDLSLRAHAVTRVAYVPDVRVVHHGGYAASKGWRHIVLFVRSAFAFFRRHGWKWC